MKTLVTIATLAFWAILTLALVGAPMQDDEAPPPAAVTASGVTVAPAAKAGIRRGDVAAHKRAEDCWMIIDAQVYDFSAYVPLHPAAPEAMPKYCGLDGTEGFLTKDRGRAHSGHARGLMANYLLSPLTP